MSNRLEVSRKQRIIGNALSVAILLAALVVIVLSYYGVIGLSFGESVVPVVLAGVGLVFFATALVQINPVSMWMAFAFLVPAAISFAVNLSDATYGLLYPLYIATPGIGCLAAMAYGKGILSLLKGAGVFIAAAVIFALHSFGVIEMWLTLVIFFAYVLVLASYVIIYLGKGERK